MKFNLNKYVIIVGIYRPSDGTSGAKERIISNRGSHNAFETKEDEEEEERNVWKLWPYILWP